jgi:hypothetical protein
MAQTATKAPEMSDFDKIGQRRDIAIQRLMEYYTAPAAKRDMLDAAHPTGDAYDPLHLYVCARMIVSLCSGRTSAAAQAGNRPA